MFSLLVRPQQRDTGIMPSKPKGLAAIPRKSHASTPVSEAESLADRLSFADAPRPFKNPHGFISKLPYRTASTTTTSVRKTSKQISVLERERVGGGDGFLPANLTLARARGEVIEPGGKKRKVLGAGGVPNKRGYNLKNRKSLNGASGVSTPATEGLESGQSTPMVEDEDEEEAEAELVEALPPGKEVFTYHTPTAPPSLLPNKKYCDITGLHASYTDPRTKLRYKGLDVWHVVRGLGPGGDQAYLALRGAQTSLK